MSRSVQLIKDLLLVSCLQYGMVNSDSEMNMKTFIAIAFLSFCSVSSFGQSAPVFSNPVQMADHPQHASYNRMACETPLAGGSADAYSYARGERPLWEFGPVSQPVPLGDAARAYRKDKVTAKKAEMVLEKQGS